MRIRVSITGAAGFIGSHLVDALLESGRYEVIAIDDLSMGSLDNIKHHIGNSSFKFHRIDVRDTVALTTCCEGSDIIVHLAAFKIPRYGNALKTLDVNSKGMWNVLEVARKNSSEVVSASTSDVYGKSKKLPFSESEDPLLGPSTSERWSYAVSKLFDEHLCLAYQEAHGVPVTSLRFFGSYGPRCHLSWWSGPQSVFISAALKNEEMEIHGDGKQTRSFTYISDTISGIIAAVENKEARGHIFNLGSTFEISILDLAKMISRLVGNSPDGPKLKFIPYESFSRNYEDVSRRVPDISKARDILGFQPTVSLEEGLEKTIKWQKEVMGL
ncbi:MAG: nucleoside-diphosphate sugar epimerase [Coxiella sp. DG_40]|nr:MAG: nucleoside-diphosphate sugar epimerase [Coxiella sp. DG_40]